MISLFVEPAFCGSFVGKW
jgi:hypothetical protein